MTEEITARDVEASGWKLQLHLNYGGGGYGYQYQSVKFPECTLAINRPKRKDPEKRTIWVGEMEVPDFKDAAELLTARSKAEKEAG